MLMYHSYLLGNSSSFCVTETEDGNVIFSPACSKAQPQLASGAEECQCIALYSPNPREG